MVAQLNREMFSDALLTPRSQPSDSEDLLRALEAARQLEARGDLGEAARWLRYAADTAERQGNDARVLELARAAADLTNKAGPVSLAAPPATLPSSLIPSVGNAAKERYVRVGSVRIAFAGSMQDSSFVVHRLAPGQRAPEGMTEAIIVLTGDVEGRVEIETALRVVDRPATKA